MFEISMQDLKSVFTDFHKLTKFTIVLYDAERHFLYAYPEKMCRFCATVRTNPVLAQRCIDCDHIGFDICDKTRKPYIYKCHMGATEAIAPIYANDMSIGYLMFGQILDANIESVQKKAAETNAKYNIHLTHAMIKEMQSVDDTFIHAAVHMMTMCANYLYTNEIIKGNPDVLAYQLKAYIRSNLSSNLSVDFLCRHFFLSRTKLYKIAKQSLGMGISDYIRIQRIKKAKKLLATTTDSVAQIAASVGIADTNYFIRLFKQTEGITPLQYRKTAT